MSSSAIRFPRSPAAARLAFLFCIRGDGRSHMLIYMQHDFLRYPVLPPHSNGGRDAGAVKPAACMSMSAATAAGIVM
jgi:hypothetical protein